MEQAAEFTFAVGDWITIHSSFRSLLVIFLCLSATTMSLAILLYAFKLWRQPRV
jgi:hypothetical protein